MDSQSETNQTMSPGFLKRWMMRSIILLLFGYILLQYGLHGLEYTSITKSTIQDIESVPYGLLDGHHFSSDPFTRDTAPRIYNSAFLNETLNLTGKEFEIDENFWNNYHFLLGDQEELSRDAMDGFVVAIAASSSHFRQSEDAVYSVQHFFPGKKILFFDWGLEANESDVVSSWCDVDLRAFNFSTIRSLIGTTSIGEAWHYQVAKAFAMAEALRDHQAVLWMDASARLLTANFDYIFEKAVGDGGVVFLDKTTQGATKTPPPVYDFFPTNTEDSKRRKHVTTSAIFVVKTRLISEWILWWWLLCSNTEKCFFEESIQTHCEINQDARKNRYIENNCSRVDHSILNVLVGNIYHYEWDIYCLESGLGTLFKVSKTGRNEAQICS